MQLSREQVAQLSDQELDVYARVVLNESHSRRAKLKRAKDYRGRQVIPAMIPLVAMCGSWLFPKLGWEVLVVFFVGAALMQWHAAGLNRRIDALLDLLNVESTIDHDSPEHAPSERRNHNQAE